MTHTSGPWILDNPGDGDVIHIRDRFLTIIATVHPRKRDGHKIDNAHLIAAAPDLVDDNQMLRKALVAANDLFAELGLTGQIPKLVFEALDRTKGGTLIAAMMGLDLDEIEKDARIMGDFCDKAGHTEAWIDPDTVLAMVAVIRRLQAELRTGQIPKPVFDALARYEEPR